MIFYFTGTGNSLYVAKKVQETTGENLIDIKQAVNENKFDYDVEKDEKIGIVFPVYYYGLPTLVSEFINKLNLKTENTPFIYTIITCGSYIGNADKNLATLLKSKNLELSSSYSVQMPSNYIMIYDTPTKEDIQSTIDAAEKNMENIIKRIKNNEKGYFADHGLIAMFTPISYMLYGVFRKTKKFYVTDKCDNCGLCETVCSSQVIRIKNGTPEWTEKKCSHCTACINRCPSKAIEYGASTKKRERYFNPHI